MSEGGMSDSDVLRELLRAAQRTVYWQAETARIEFLRYREEELAKPRNENPKRLLRYGFKTFSQNDEDGIIQEIFRRIGTKDRKGYRIVGCSFAGVNAFFVREDLCGEHFIEPATADEHYEPPRYVAKIMPAGHQPQPGEFQIV